MKVRFGISVAPSGPLLRRDETAQFSDLVRMAEDYGATAIGTYDSAFIGGDAFVRATLIALASTRARVGLRPTNPLTREPQVMTSFLASVDSLTGGRAFVEIASGDSAVLNIGYKIASRAYRGLRELHPRPAGERRGDLSQAAAADPLVVDRRPRSYSNLYLRRGSPDAVSGRTNR